MIADQQAALFGYDCRTPGAAACTHGTGSYVNVAAGATIPPMPPDSMAKIYLAWEIEGAPTYALEADTTVTGAVVRWMQEQMGWLRSPSDLDALARTAPTRPACCLCRLLSGWACPMKIAARGAPCWA